MEEINQYLQLQFYLLELLNNMFKDIDNINKEVEKFQSNSSDELEQFRIAYLGKKGKVTLLFSVFKQVSNEQKKDLREFLNDGTGSNNNYF